ncbi:unnamed protein product [Notodromas monacha]|uniref:Splicing factor 3A subunit 3 n=1 Tax=Notodromas monacha TaxID=399045 RepID=A0A7R9BP12_9CRUS|nr:unnamed protein product [Notodromas monacha]CAG0917672.1 unnamed protein product [Notodromas monacha]
MSTESVLELQRRYHEERERITDAVVKEILVKKSSLKENINSEHRMKMLLERHNEVSAQLLELYEDKDGARKEEIQALSGPNEFAEFYSRMRAIKEFHRRHPNEISVPMSVEFMEWDKLRENPSDEANLVDFSGEEGYGRYLDLHECYLKYINLRGIEKLDYISYLETFDQLFDIPRERKNAEYLSYLDALVTYFVEYVGKVRPLLDLNKELDEVTKDFEKQWASGSFPGWSKENKEPQASANDGEHLDLSPFNTWEELASLGLDRLKSALVALGLKCGGTLEERAQRLFYTKGKSLSEIDAGLFAKTKAKNRGKDELKMKDIAFTEAKEWRHAHGMRCLGIPNTAHFANVTDIEDAMRLWEKLKGQKNDERWKPEQEEEYEDSQGNVVNKKTYDDLKRQGLL